jgi:anhydro-N-acetylmuramic acid kinase
MRWLVTIASWHLHPLCGCLFVGSVTLRAIGLMSGTSLDAVDVALIESDGHVVLRRGPASTRPYSAEERHVLRQALQEAIGLQDRNARPGILQSAEGLITIAHAEAVEAFLKQHGIDPKSIDVIGFHGQTVLHRPEQTLTVQIGDGQSLADRLGIKVVHDLRADDVAAGGQGAPLVPVYHKALAEAAGLKGPLAILNIGGVANVTLISSDGALRAFDTGPGNALVDDFVLKRTGKAYDDDGQLAAAGKPDEALLAWVMSHPFFVARPPKSLDRNWFAEGIAAHLSVEDGAATLTEFTVRAILRALDFQAEKPASWIVAGGGAKNSTMLKRLQQASGAVVTKADDLGWSADSMEAEAFAFLAIRSVLGLPITFPSTTGIREPLTGGRLAIPMVNKG